MSEQPIADFKMKTPCYNQCVMKGTEDNDEPTLMTSLHGHFCDREFHAMNEALKQVAETVEHVVSLVMSKSQSDDNVQASKESPLPFNTQAFNDANETYGRIVFWARHWAKVLKRQAPGAAVRAWKTEGGRVVGLPYDVSPSDARYAVSTMAIWLQAHLEDICWQTPSDDVAYFHDELRDVFRVAARWPSEMKPRVAKIPCPGDCQGRVAVFPPREAGDHTRIVCEKCGRVFGEDDFEHEIRVFKQLQDERAKASSVAERLARKYSA